MPYSPQTQFDPSLIFRGISGAGDSLGSGIASAIAKREKAEAQTAGSAIAFHTLRNAGLLSDDEQTAFNKGNANQRHGIIMEAMPRLLQKFQTTKENNEQAYRQNRLKFEQKMLEAQNYSSPYAQQPVWMTDPQSGESYQAGIYDEKGSPHFLPYGGARATTPAFQPDDATAEALKSAGYTWAQTSQRSGRWINTDQSKPDLGPDGNPLFTPDGTGYISRGQVKPITDAMQRQRMMGQMQQPQGGPSPAPRAPTPRLQPDPAIIQNPFGATSAPSPSATPGATGKVRVKRPDGQIGLIPADQLQAAIAAGFAPVQ